MAIKLGAKDLFPYLGDYRPVNIYKGENKIAGWKWTEQSGEELYFENTYNDFVDVEIDGKSVQEGEPTPDYPIEIHSVNDFDVVSSTEKLSEGQLEEYNHGVEYENIYKINLSLSEPLRSVGDFKDRLFRDSDGLWKVERNTQEYRINGSESWTTVWGATANTYPYFWAGLPNSNGYPEDEKNVLSDRFTSIDRDNLFEGSFVDKEGVAIGGSNGYMVIRIGKDRISSYSVNLFKQWLSENPINVVYKLTNPSIEILNQEFQDKLNILRSFRDSNYVYTTGSIEPHLIGKVKVKDV